MMRCKVLIAVSVMLQSFSNHAHISSVASEVRRVQTRERQTAVKLCSIFSDITRCSTFGSPGVKVHVTCCTFTRYTFHKIYIYTEHYTQYNIHSALYTVYIIHSTLQTVHCTHYTQYIIHSTLYTIHYTQYIIHSTLYITS